METLKLPTIQDLDLQGKTVLLRTDYNVPLDQASHIQSDFRIRTSLPTLEFLLTRGASKIVILSHLGRPEGKHVPELSLRPVAHRLQELLHQPVQFVSELAALSEISTSNRQIFMLENLRFYPGEEADSPEFAKQIVDATKADYFVQEGFAVLHRAHASTSTLPKLLPSAAGLLVAKEVAILTKLLQKPAVPLTVIIGGAKIADKQPLVDRFLPIADHIIIGGKIAASGAKFDNPKIYVAEDFHDQFDLGPRSIQKIIEIIQNSRTIVWNGLLGQAEQLQYATASLEIAQAISDNKQATSIICGGDTVGFIENLPNQLDFSLLSTGGGASLEFLSGVELPGLSTLDM